MSDLLAFSFDLTVSPKISLAREVPDPDRAAQSWGLGWFPDVDRAAVVVKDPSSAFGDPLVGNISDWERFRSTTFVAFVRGAADRQTQEDTQPFVRAFGRRSWVIAQRGNLEPGYANRLKLGANPAFEPMGGSDTEWLLCWLMTKTLRTRARRLEEIGWSQLHQWLRKANRGGELNLVLTDGHDLIVYQDENDFSPMSWARKGPSSQRDVLAGAEIEIDLSDPRDTNRTGVLFSNRKLSGGWSALDAGQLVVVRRGAFVYDSRDQVEELNSFLLPPRSEAKTQAVEVASQQSLATVESATPTTAETPATAEPPRPATEVSDLPIAERYSSERRGTRVEIRHLTRYTYSQAVGRSRHLLRLRPVQDTQQRLLEHTLRIHPEKTEARSYEDAFGNWMTRFEISEPFKELIVESTSVVELFPLDPTQQTTAPATIPIPWMPWDRQLVQAYLLPMDLPEIQLRELFDYAMSFADRQRNDLLATLDDINRTIYRDFVYTPGFTTLETTPFEVYSTRKGVCQDFANLLICLGRLLGVPARYRTGYIHTGADYENTKQSEASHAWAELYLPRIGWVGFDPTNGCLALHDHVRVACGRNYRDATPTSGTILSGGRGEKLEIDVQVHRRSPDTSARDLSPS
ncbi:MAG: class II glutamine amidotransferase [Acidobacteriota bacterium]